MDEGFSPLATGRVMPGNEKCPENVPGTHNWRHYAYSYHCMECGIEFDKKNHREIVTR